MNPQILRQSLQKLAHEDLLALKSGCSLCLEDDQLVSVCKDADTRRLTFDLAPECVQATCIRKAISKQAAAILEQYYRSHPLSLAGFNRQALPLVEKFGAARFSAPAPKRAEMTLFVDTGEVMAMQVSDVRHAYGCYCEVAPGSLDAEQQVIEWIQSSEAYQQYLSMNMCRYNC